MGLLNPLGLLWLLLAVPIVLLYLLRLQRRELTVASVLLWEHAVDDLQANAPFQKLRRNLLLYLQLAALALATLAAARPFVRTSELGGRSVVILLDASASMAAAERGGTRFAQARARIGRLLGQMARGEEAMLILASDRAEVLCPFTGDRRALRRALHAAAPLDRPTDLRDALLLAASATRGRPDSKVYLFSDGAVPDAADLVADVSRVEFVPIGEPVENVAITAFDARRNLRDEVPEVLLGLRLGGPAKPREVAVELRLDDRLFDVRGYSLEPGRPRVLVLGDLPARAGLLEARLAEEDALAADNRAYVSLGARRDVELWLVGKGNTFLEQALLLCPGVRVIKAGATTLQQAAAEGRLPAGTIAVYAGEAPAMELPVPGLWLNAVGPGAPVGGGASTVELPPVVDWSMRHPVLRDVDLSEVAISKARRVALQPWAATLAETGATPLIAAGERRGGRQVFVGFDLLDSDWPLRPGFPIFIANTIGWLGATGGPEAVPAIRAGDAVTLRLATSASTATWQEPDGSRRPVAVAAGGLVTVAEPRRVGLHQVTAAGATATFAVSLLSPAESDLTPRGELRLGKVRVAAPLGERERERELWLPLLYAMMALLLVEWWWFHRRG